MKQQVEFALAHPVFDPLPPRAYGLHQRTLAAPPGLRPVRLMNL